MTPHRPTRVLLCIPVLETGPGRVFLNLANHFDSRIEPIVAVTQGGDLLAELRPGIRVIEVGRPSARYPIISLLRAVWRERPDVVLGTLRMVFTVGTASLLFPRRTRTVLRLAIHVSGDLTQRPRLGRLRRAVEAFALRCVLGRSDGIVCQSAGMARDLADRHPRLAAKIATLTNPVDVSMLAEAARDPLPHELAGAGPVVVAAGRLTPEKGFDTLLRAFADVARAHDDVSLWLLGRGAEEARLRALVQQLGIDDRVELLGQQANPFPFYARASVFALSSRVEGLSNAALEALALGTPVIASTGPAAGDAVVQHDDDGTLIAEPTADALAAALDRELRRGTDPASRAARTRRAEQRFGAASVADAYATFLRSLTGDRTRANVLCAVNFPLPDSDYRIHYARASDAVRTELALPRRPDALPCDRFHEMTVGEGVSPRHLPGLVQLARVLRQRRHHLDLAHFFSAQLYLAGPAFARLAGVPSVVTITGFGRATTERRMRWLSSLYWLALRHSVTYSRLVLFQNRSDMTTLAERWPWAEPKMRYAPSAVDFPSHQHDFSSATLRVLLVSRLAEGKGIDDFLDVAARCRRDDLEFVLVGPAARGATALLARVEQAASDGLICYRGRLEGAELEACYRDAHIFLFPSHAEGLARVLLEAGCSGLAPVAYDIPGNRDVVPAPDAYLVETFDTDRLVAAIDALRRDRSLLADRAARFHEWVTERFDLASYVSRTDGFLKEAIDA